MTHTNEGVTMPGYEMYDLDKIKYGLTVDVTPGLGCMGTPDKHDTDIWIKPPVTADEIADLNIAIGRDSDFARRLDPRSRNSVRHERYTQVTLSGAPTERHINLATNVTLALMAARGLQAAILKTNTIITSEAISRPHLIVVK